MKHLALIAATLAFTAIACTTSSAPGDDPTDPTDPSDPGTTDAGSDTPDPSTLDPASCEAFANNAVAAQQACGGSVPANAITTLTEACKKGVTKASLCGGAPADGLTCFESEDPSDWVCTYGAIYPYCNNDLEAALGMYCLVSLGSPACASIACEGSLDCPTGSSCNDVTHQCFSNSASCIGLPCDGSLDCPTGETCNQAEHACVAQ